MNTEETIVHNTTQRLEAMPKPEIENFLKASKEELAREVVNLRLFVAQLFLEIKEYRREHDIYVNAGMDHHSDDIVYAGEAEWAEMRYEQEQEGKE